MKHKHAELMALYAQDAMETQYPWERWEIHCVDGEWMQCNHHPEWGHAFEYRRKPRTININGFEVPEPVREPLGYGLGYWFPNLSAPDKFVGISSWSEDEIDYIRMRRGLIHLTREAAEAHARALLSFTEQ